MPRFYVSIADANRILDTGQECLTLLAASGRPQGLFFREVCTPASTDGSSGRGFASGQSRFIPPPASVTPKAKNNHVINGVYVGWGGRIRTTASQNRNSGRHAWPATQRAQDPENVTSPPCLTPVMRGSWLRCTVVPGGAVSLSHWASVLRGRELAHSWDIEQYSRLPASSAARILTGLRRRR
jgi:hypothetical protein